MRFRVSMSDGVATYADEFETASLLEALALKEKKWSDQCQVIWVKVLDNQVAGRLVDPTAFSDPSACRRTLLSSFVIQDGLLLPILEVVFVGNEARKLVTPLGTFKTKRCPVVMSQCVQNQQLVSY